METFWYWLIRVVPENVSFIFTVSSP